MGDGGPAIMEFSTFETAVEAYLRYCRRNGVIYRQSDEALSRVGRKSVSLETVRVEYHLPRYMGRRFRGRRR